MKKCSKHPKFKGKKKPEYQCAECLSIYFELKGRRIPTPPPSKIIPDSTKFNRKTKHKKDFE